MSSLNKSFKMLKMLQPNNAREKPKLGRTQRKPHWKNTYIDYLVKNGKRPGKKNMAESAATKTREKDAMKERREKAREKERPRKSLAEGCTKNAPSEERMEKPRR